MKGEETADEVVKNDTATLHVGLQRQHQISKVWQRETFRQGHGSSSQPHTCTCLGLLGYKCRVSKPWKAQGTDSSRSLERCARRIPLCRANGHLQASPHHCVPSCKSTDAPKMQQLQPRGLAQTCTTSVVLLHSFLPFFGPPIPS